MADNRPLVSRYIAIFHQWYIIRF